MALKRTRMWGCYHRLRTADTFIHDWQRFITQSVGTKAFPAFYQYVTQHIFEKLIKLEYSVEDYDQESESHLRSFKLTKSSKCALRYVAGYTIIRKVYEKMQSSSHPNKENIMYVLMELLSDGFNSDDASERWINMINRGGLWRIFMIMEVEVRKHCTLVSKNKELLCTATCIK